MKKEPDTTHNGWSTMVYETYVSTFNPASIKQQQNAKPLVTSSLLMKSAKSEVSGGESRMRDVTSGQLQFDVRHYCSCP